MQIVRKFGACWKKAGLPIVSLQPGIGEYGEEESWDPERVGICDMRADANDPTAVAKSSVATE